MSGSTVNQNNMRKKNWLCLLPAFFMLAGCGIKYERNMTEAAQLTADKVCGIYQAVEATWDGEPLDVNNDGVAKESFLEELLDGPYLGIQYDPSRLTTRVNPCYYSKSLTSVSFPFFKGCYSELYLRSSIPLYTCESIDIYYQIDDDGLLTIQDQFVYLRTAGEHDHDQIQNVSIKWEADGYFIVSGQTGFYNFLTQRNTEGRATFRYHCISTKEKKQR